MQAMQAMQKLLKVLLIPSLILVANMSLAEDETRRGIGLGVKGGTTGANIDITFPLTKKLNLRGSYSTFSFDETVSDTSTTYNAAFDMTSVSLLLDWHPLGGGLRVSGGLYNYLDNELTGSAVPAGGQTFTINNVVYDSADLASLDLKVEFESIAPYVGVGWGNAVGDGRLSFVVDIGVVNIGSPEVAMAYSCINALLCSTIISDVDAEIVQLETDIEDFQWWPVLNVGIAFKF